MRYRAAAGTLSAPYKAVQRSRPRHTPQPFQRSHVTHAYTPPTPPFRQTDGEAEDSTGLNVFLSKLALSKALTDTSHWCQVVRSGGVSARAARGQRPPRSTRRNRFLCQHS